MKLNLAFANDPELWTKLGCFQRLFPTKGQDFLEVLKHVHNALVQLDGGTVLLQQFKLASDSAQDDPAPFPSRDVDGGDILKF